MLSKLLIILVILQITIVISLGVKIKNQKDTLSLSVGPIKKSSLIFPKSSIYLSKYFYEPVPNSIDEGDLKLIGINSSVKDTINSDGLNQSSNYPATKSADIYRIVAMGDSFTYGKNVNTEDNYPSQLEKLLNAKMQCKNISSFQVLNFGVNGYDIPFTVQRYRLRGQKYNPDLVLWFLIDNDFKRDNDIPFPTDTKMDINQMIDWKVKKAGGIQKLIEKENKYMNNFTDYYKGSLLLFSFNNLGIEDHDLLKNYSISRTNTYLYTNLISEYFKKEDDMFTSGNNPNQDIFLPDGHPNPKGYILIVNDLYNYIIKNKIIPCDKS